MLRNSKQDSESNKSSVLKPSFIENSGLDIPTSYRIPSNITLTPYSNWRVKDIGIKIQTKNLVNRAIWTSQNKSRPMSYTFTNSHIAPNNFENKMICTVKDFEQERMNKLNSKSRKSKIESKNSKAMKWMKRNETNYMHIPFTLDSKTPHPKDLTELKVLNYYIPVGHIDQEYKITPIVLGSGSYAIVKLGEMVDNPENKVAIKIYEKWKLFASKHRRKNLSNEISVLKSMNHK